MVTMEYMQQFFEEFAYPADAQEELLSVYERILCDAALCSRFEQAEEKLCDASLEREAYLTPLAGIADAVNAAQQTVPLLCMIAASQKLQAQYAQANISRDIWHDTMLDLRTKAMECKRLEGVYGLFGTVTPAWLVNYFRMQRFALGRMQYEIGAFKQEDCCIGGITLHKGDPVLCCHIPSNGQPFDENARLASYKAAYNFYKEAFPARYNGCVPITCDSWLLFPDHAEMLGERSNIVGFMREFRLLREDRAKTHANLWRIFWRTDTENIPALPEDSGLQCAYKKRLLSGGDVGGGYGIFFFDGKTCIR